MASRASNSKNSSVLLDGLFAHVVSCQMKLGLDPSRVNFEAMQGSLHVRPFKACYAYLRKTAVYVVQGMSSILQLPLLQPVVYAFPEHSSV